MKLDVNILRYLSKDDFRVLTAVEMGQKNVSAQLYGPQLGLNSKWYACCVTDKIQHASRLTCSCSH